MWTASDTVRIGDLYVGVRSYPTRLSTRVRAALAPDVVDGVEAPPNYSVRFEERVPGRPGSVSAYVLYRSQCSLLRTRKRERVLRALVACVSGHRGRRDGLLRIRQLAVVGRSGAVILPVELHWRLEALERRLGAHGLRLADPPFVDIDPRKGELVVAPPEMGVVTALGGSRRSASHARARPEPRRYPIREWAILRREGDRPPTVHESLSAVMPMFDGDERVPGALEGMMRALSGTKLTPIWYQRPGKMMERLVASTR